MSRIFQMFTSPWKMVEDNESDEQEQVTASSGPIRKTDAPLVETNKRPRRHSSNSSRDELRKKTRIESLFNITEEEEESDFSDEEVSLHVFANAPRMGTSYHVLSQTFHTEIECFQLCIKREVN